MLRAVRSLLAVCLLLAACMGTPPAGEVAAQPAPLQITARAVPFKLDDPAARQVGRLIWRGGIAMTANSPHFGGWSDLYVTPDGRRLSSISDVGGWFTAAIDYDKDGNLAGLSDATIGPLRGQDGKPLSEKEWADCEGMAHLPDGAWLLSFERRHRIWRYPTLDGTPTPIDQPPDVAKQPHNGGIEALTALADGRVIAISEEMIVRPGFLAGWLGTPGGEGHYAWQRFEYAKTPEFNPTAITQLPDGSLAMLERAFDYVQGARIRVMHFAASELRPGNEIHAAEVARLASPYAVDNLEGLAARKGNRGETLLWMIADDNFNPLQRNLLLMFELAP
jgi:hypothetical protein